MMTTPADPPVELPAAPSILAMTFHHVGVGVIDMDAAIAVYESLGHRLVRRVDDPGINIKVAFLASPANGPWIELLAPLEPDGPLNSLIKRRVLPSPYHTCYGVEALDSAADFLRENGFIPLGPARPAIAFDGARVSFHYHAVIGMIELVERPPEWPRS